MMDREGMGVSLSIAVEMREEWSAFGGGAVPCARRSISVSKHNQANPSPHKTLPHHSPQQSQAITSSYHYLCSQSSFQPKLAETEEEEEAEGDGARAMFLPLLLLLPLLPLLLLLAVLSLVVLLLALVVPPSVGSGEGDGDEDMDHKEERDAYAHSSHPSPGCLVLRRCPNGQ